MYKFKFIISYNELVMEEEDEIISEVPKPITQNDTYIDEDDEMIQRLIDKLNGIRLMIDEDVSKVKEREMLLRN